MQDGVWFPWLEANQGFLSLLALVSALMFALFEHFRWLRAEAERRRNAAALAIEIMRRLKSALLTGDARQAEAESRLGAEALRAMAQSASDSAATLWFLKLAHDVEVYGQALSGDWNESMRNAVLSLLDISVASLGDLADERAAARRKREINRVLER